MTSLLHCSLGSLIPRPSGLGNFFALKKFTQKAGVKPRKAEKTEK